MIERLDYVSINGAAIASMAKAKKDMPSIDPKLRAVNLYAADNRTTKLLPRIAQQLM